METKALKILNSLVPVLPIYGEKKGKIIRDGDRSFYIEASPPRPEASHSGGFYLFGYEEGEISEWGSYLHPQTRDTENVRAFYSRFIVDHENDLRELTKEYFIMEK